MCFLFPYGILLASAWYVGRPGQPHFSGPFVSQGWSTWPIIQGHASIHGAFLSKARAQCLIQSILLGTKTRQDCPLCPRGQQNIGAFALVETLHLRVIENRLEIPPPKEIMRIHKEC